MNIKRFTKDLIKFNHHCLLKFLINNLRKDENTLARVKISTKNFERIRSIDLNGEIPTQSQILNKEQVALSLPLLNTLLKFTALETGKTYYSYAKYLHP